MKNEKGQARLFFLQSTFLAPSTALPMKRARRDRFLEAAIMDDVSRVLETVYISVRTSPGGFCFE